jgi:hypothetical protein
VVTRKGVACANRFTGERVSDRTVHYRTCPLCEAMCGLEIHVEGDAVPLIRADRDDVWSKGSSARRATWMGYDWRSPASTPG